MKQVLTEEPFAAFIGIDWADAKHDLCLQAVGCDKSESSTSNSIFVRFHGNLTGKREKLTQKTASVLVSFMEKGFYHS